MAERKTRSRNILEKDIQKEILEWLDTKDGLMFWRQNNGAVFGRNNAGAMAFRKPAKYTALGVPDIWVIWKGHAIGLEVKRPGGNIRDEQKEFGRKLIFHGGYYFVVYSLDDAKRVLRTMNYD